MIIITKKRVSLLLNFYAIMKKIQNSLFAKFEASKMSASYNKMIAGGVNKYTHEGSTGRWDVITGFGTKSASLEYTTQERDANSNP
jgi:hypothetical protein